MTDGVQKGAGNAYTLHTVANALSLYPTYEDFIRAFASGQIFTDLKINTPGWNTTGTALNKANLLSDAVETAIWGSTANRTPNQALEKLRALITTAQSTANGKGHVSYGTYTANGSKSKTLTFPFEPKFLIVMGGGSSGILIFLKDYMGTSIYANFDDSAAHPMDFGSTMGLKAAWTANSVTWTGYNAGWAGNSGGTAHYICVG